MKTKYLALSHKFLSRLSYHFIWGLGLDRNGYKSFFEIVKELHLDSNQRKEMVDKVNNILSKTGILGYLIRSFYWVFNINHYCQDYYQLQAYYSWRLYEEGINMFSDNERPLIEQQNGFISESQEPQASIARGVSIVVDTVVVTPVKWLVVNPIMYIGGGIAGIFLKEKTDDSSLQTVDADVTHFKVTRKAQEYLNVLNITDAEFGYQYEIASVKRQYKKLCVTHHPDKGGNLDTFTTIDEAYKNLLKHISPDKNLLGLDERYAEHFAEAREHEENQRCIKRADEVHAASDKFMAEIEKNLAEAEKLLEECLEEKRLANEDSLKPTSKKTTKPASSSMFDNMCYRFFGKKRDNQDSTTYTADNNNSYG